MGAASVDPRRRGRDGGAGDAPRGAPIADAELERLWLRGDPRALGFAHQQHRARLERVAFRILGSRADAEDVVQRIFVTLRRTRGASFEGRASLWSYLYRAAVNGAVNVLRSTRRREAAEQQLALHERFEVGAQAPDPHAMVLEGEILAGVARTLLQVKPQHRRVLVLRIMHGLSNAEIAEREGLPPATVGTWLRRGRLELQRGLRPLLRELR